MKAIQKRNIEGSHLLVPTMSDWRSVRNRQHKGAKEEEENQFVFEDTSVDDDDDDVEVVKTESTEVDKPETKEVSISPERKEELVIHEASVQN